MKRNVQFIVSALVVSLLVFMSSLDAASAQKSPGDDLSGEVCPHQEVKEVQGSKIVFLEHAFDFGQIPTDRKVTHIFRFQNRGTEPLLLAKHIKSKPIEGC